MSVANFIEYRTKPQQGIILFLLKCATSLGQINSISKMYLIEAIYLTISCGFAQRQTNYYIRYRDFNIGPEHMRFLQNVAQATPVSSSSLRDVTFGSDYICMFRRTTPNEELLDLKTRGFH